MLKLSTKRVHYECIIRSLKWYLVSYSLSDQVLVIKDHHLLPPVLLHGQDLDHSDKNVDEVQLKVDGLVDRILRHEASLSQAGMVENLLHIVQGEATEDSKTAVQPDILSPHQCAGSGGGDDHGSETRQSDNGDTSEEGTTEVHVFIGLCGGADERERAHETCSVETGACEDGGVHEEERGEESGLSDIEGGPEGVFLDIAVAVSAWPSNCIWNVLTSGGW